MKRFAFLAALICLFTVVPAGAQEPAFEAEIDCEGVHQPGASVPFTVRFENQTFQTQSLETTISFTIPSVGTRTLLSRTITLNPNQDRAFNRSLNLPAGAPVGNYSMSITATNGTETTFDTCSFNVVP